MALTGCCTFDFRKRKPNKAAKQRVVDKNIIVATNTADT